MKKIIYIILLSALISPILAEEKCTIPGKAMHWVVDYCMYLSETDDFYSGNVEECFKKITAIRLKTRAKIRKNTKLKYASIKPIAVI